jgi:hypothetical protein
MSTSQLHSAVLLTAACLSLAGAAHACAPEVTAEVVSSVPSKAKIPNQARVLRSFWHAKRFLISVEQVASCAPAEPVDVVHEVSGNSIKVAWAWSDNPSSEVCTRQVDLTFYSLDPAKSYKVIIAKNAVSSAHCK